LILSPQYMVSAFSAVLHPGVLPVTLAGSSAGGNDQVEHLQRGLLAGEVTRRLMAWRTGRSVTL
jgi:hypothetical protein